MCPSKFQHEGTERPVENAHQALLDCDGRVGGGKLEATIIASDFEGLGTVLHVIHVFMLDFEPVYSCHFALLQQHCFSRMMRPPLVMPHLRHPAEIKQKPGLLLRTSGALTLV